MRTLYFDCFSGMSGDMTLAALVDAGANAEEVERQVAKLPLEPFEIEWKRVNKKGVSALKMDVHLKEGHEPRHHRHYADIVQMIQEGDWNENVKQMSTAIFQRIGVAEGAIHGIPLERVHFHEVGAIDSIVDVVGVAIALDQLQVERIGCAPLPLGYGKVRCAHGLYPVPAPATLEMLRGIPLAASKHPKELTTPTGAGIASALVDDWSVALPAIRVQDIGYGAGTMDLDDQPNILRIVIGEAEAGK